MALKNPGASVINRLKNKAQGSGRSFQMHLQLFCQEEFLRRLSLSRHADSLILKGGLLIFSLTRFESRATVDVDFLLRKIPSTIQEIESMVDQIMTTRSENDFVSFTIAHQHEIALQRQYSGVSFQVIGHIENTKTPFAVDIGIDDVVYPEAVRRELPVQLETFHAPRIWTYPLESTISEKLDALLQRLEMTSRMKDIYDIYYLSQSFEFTGQILQTSISKTFQKRGTPVRASGLDEIVALEHVHDIQIRWRAFLRRLDRQPLTLDEALHGIDRFLRPVWNALTGGTIHDGVWDCQLRVWNKPE